jgi:hypothetical protein
MGLRPGQAYPIWRGREPLQTQLDDRVYFVDAQGEIYLYARYAGYQYRTAYQRQRLCQIGWAILVTAPVTPMTPPFPLPWMDPTIKPGGLGPWRWRYDGFHQTPNGLRQYG